MPWDKLGNFIVGESKGWACENVGFVGVAGVASEGQEIGEDVGVRESCMVFSETGEVYFVLAVGLVR